ncbi:MAG: hypothetical protein ABI833_17080 [Acidobacteriota bacterium]
MNDANRKFTHPRPDGWKPRRDRSRHISNQVEVRTMLKHMMNTSTFRALVSTVAIAVLAVFVSVSAGTAAENGKTLGQKELKNLIANSETKADHERIAKHFDAEAAKYEAEAKEHGELVPFYKASPDPALSKHPGSPRSAQHCDSLSKSLLQAAEDARGLAAEHRGMEKDAKK